MPPMGLEVNLTVRTVAKKWCHFDTLQIMILMANSCTSNTNTTQLIVGPASGAMEPRLQQVFCLLDTFWCTYKDFSSHFGLIE